MNTISGGGAFTRQNISDLNGNFSALSSLAAGTNGNVLWCVPSAVGLSTQDGSQANPFTSLAAAYAAGRNAANDVIVLAGNGSASGTARLTGTFTWAKDALHLIGVSSGVNISTRARIAPMTSVTAFANLFVVSGNGCHFENIEWFDGFATGTTAQICLTVTGGRNYFGNCHIAGMGDAASAADAGSRSVLISGTGENMFVNSTIGLDTVARVNANASVEFAGGAPRNQFIACLFPFLTTASSPLGLYVAATAGSDRFQYFRQCAFINAIQSTSTIMSGLSTLPASMGGMFVMKDCSLVGITEFGTDATSRNQIYVDGGTVTAATSGIAVNPT